MLVTVPHATGISYKFTRAVNLPFLPNAHVREISLLERGFEARDFCFELPASPINKCFYGVDNRLSEFFAIETHGSSSSSSKTNRESGLRSRRVGRQNVLPLGPDTGRQGTDRDAYAL
jgi:hypothetical protein